MTRESYPVWTPAMQVAESNRIENIHKASAAEVEEHKRFLTLDELTVAELVHFVSVYQPNARLRLNGENVRIGDYYPPPGGQAILHRLDNLLDSVNAIDYWQRPKVAWEWHVEYEKLHPFTDGNGRSGRALWYWMMRAQLNPDYLGFLRRFYYQTLARQQS